MYGDADGTQETWRVDWKSLGELDPISGTPIDTTAEFERWAVRHGVQYEGRPQIVGRDWQVERWRQVEPGRAGRSRRSRRLPGRARRPQRRPRSCAATPKGTSTRSPRTSTTGRSPVIRSASSTTARWPSAPRIRDSNPDEGAAPRQPGPARRIRGQPPRRQAAGGDPDRPLGRAAGHRASQQHRAPAGPPRAAELGERESGRIADARQQASAGRGDPRGRSGRRRRPHLRDGQPAHPARVPRAHADRGVRAHAARPGPHCLGVLPRWRTPASATPATGCPGSSSPAPGRTSAGASSWAEAPRERRPAWGP